MPIPPYDFEGVAEGFCRTIDAAGLTASATVSAKKKAKTVAAALLVEALGGARVYRV